MDIDERASRVFKALSSPAALISLLLLVVRLAPAPSPNTKPPEFAREMSEFHATWLSPPWWLVFAPVLFVLLAPWVWAALRLAWVWWETRLARK